MKYGSKCLFFLDIDECKAKTSSCGPGAFCENTVGSFRCKCPAGTTGDPTKGCQGTIAQKCRSDSQCRTGKLYSIYHDIFSNRFIMRVLNINSVKIIKIANIFTIFYDFPACSNDREED